MSLPKVCTKCGALTIGGNKCATCGAAQLIPLESPLARKLIAETGQTEVAARATIQARASSSRRAWIAVVGVFAVLGIMILIGNVANSDQPATPSAPAPARNPDQDAKELRTADLVSSLYQSARDPSSLTVNSVLYMPSGAICMEYRARNGFGGLNLEHGLETPKGLISVGDFDNFAEQWNRFCTGKVGDDMTYYAKGIVKINSLVH